MAGGASTKQSGDIAPGHLQVGESHDFLLARTSPSSLSGGLGWVLKSLWSAQGRLFIGWLQPASAEPKERAANLSALPSPCDPRANGEKLLKELLIIKRKLTFHLVQIETWPG